MCPLTPSPSNRASAILACLRHETTPENAAAELGVSIDDVQRWEADFIAAGLRALQDESSASGKPLPQEGEIADAMRRTVQLGLAQSIATRAIEDLDVQAVLSFTAQATCAELGYAAVSIGLITPDRQHLTVTSSSCAAPGETPSAQVSEIPIDKTTVIGSAVLEGRLVQVDGPSQLDSPTGSIRHASGQSALAVPIYSKGTVIGVIGMESIRTFDDTDMAMIAILSDQLTIAIRGAGLFQQTQAQFREISLFRRLADEAIVGIITRDIEGVIDYSNPAAAMLYGFDDPAALHGKSVRTLYPNDTWYDIDKQLCIRAMRHGGWSGEVTQQRQNGEPIIIDMSIFPIYAPDGAFMTYGTVLQDATERHRLLDAVQRSIARFEAILEATEDGIIVWDEFWQILMVNGAASRLLDVAPGDVIGLSRADLSAQPRLMAVAHASENEPVDLSGDVRCIARCRHLRWHSGRSSGYLTMIYDITSQVELEESREEFTSILIHDLVGPLTSVVGGIYMVKSMIEEHEEPESVLHFLDMAYRNGNMLLDLANSLLDIKQLEAGRMVLACSPLEIDRLFEDVTSMFGNAALAAGITVRTSPDSDLPVLLADTGMIRRALANLLDNALKFTPDGGEVTLSATRDGDNMIRFSVADTGPGVPEAFRRRIFEKHVQVPGQEGRRRGRGLGLVFCRLVAEAHQGRIWIEPRPGGGSIFVLTVSGTRPEDTGDS